METRSGRTIAEKILSRKAGAPVRAGDITIAAVDQLLGTDGSAPTAIQLFHRIGFEHVTNPAGIAFSCDHYSPAPNARIAALHDGMRRFADQHGIALFRAGEGIGHQRMIETGRIRPGTLVAGADSHCVTYGALNALGVGIGTSDLAGAMGTGKLWLKVPESLRIVLTGQLRPYCSGKDIILEILRRIGAEGGNYLALEFTGPGVTSLDVEHRIVISNMATETGAKAALFPLDEAAHTYLHGCGVEETAGVAADADASYAATIEIDLDRIEPAVAVPHNVDGVVPISQAAGRAVDMVFVGTCTGGRASDIRQVLDAIRASGGIAPGVELVVTPASAIELGHLAADGSLAELLAFGAQLTTPGCGACCGTSGAIPREGATVISTGNRNFKGRMGALTADIFLASPAACGAAAATGRIADPRNEA